MERQALRDLLERIAARGETRSYQEVAAMLGLAPPRTIRRLASALEALMDEDVADGRPLLAAVVVSQRAPGLPAAGFFHHARALGRYRGPDAGAEAAAFHAEELAAVHARHAGRR